jgi:hypothetical protein
VTVKGATAAGTDQVGGITIFQGGLGTGNGNAGHVKLQSGLPIASGTTAHTVGDRIFITGQRTALADNTVATFAQLSVASGAMVAGTIFYTVRASNGTDHQVEAGQYTFSAVNKAGTMTVASSATANTSQALSAGTLAISSSVTAGTDAINLRITSDTSLTTTTHDIAYTIVVNATTTVTPQ